ncbi:MAG TPA: prolyl oligopeptidase family serine peptidase, partial [Rhodothermia bacterium]|nr:prolyl oligopeptidase family serine peptidase [Rhodothermia bacterium]
MTRRTNQRCLPFILALLFACAPRTPSGTATENSTAATRSPQQYTMEDFYANTSYSGASWSSDRKHILVSSNATGIWNVYAIPAAGGAPLPLTQSTTQSIYARSYFPSDDRVLYSSDQGGNELTHIYVRDPDGTTRDLTPGAKVKASFESWAGDNKSFFVSTNERDERYFDLYEIAVDGYRRALLYQNTAGFELGAISRDKRYLALSKPRTTSDSDIHLYDVRDKTTRNITTHTGSVSNTPADFSPDGSKLLFVSDSGGEFASLRAYDIATGAKTTIYEQSWDIIGADYSRGGRYLVVYVNDDSRFAARVLDAATLNPVVLPGMPTGLVRGVSISRDDSALAFYASDGSTPSDLYSARIGAAPARVTNALNAKIRRDDLVVPKVVRFKSYDGVEVPGVLYIPHQASSQRKAPAIVLVHGGPGGQAQVGYSPLTQALVNHGYVVFDINNRGSSGYGKTFYTMDDRKHGEADLGDVVASKQMLIATGVVDANRIGIMGGSYGGYMVLAALTLQPDAFKVGVDLFGISNWMRTLTNIPPWWESFREA